MSRKPCVSEAVSAPHSSRSRNRCVSEAVVSGRLITVSRKPCGRSWTVVPGIYPEPGAAFETPRAFLGSRFQAGSRGHRARFSRQIGARLSRHFHAASETDWHGFRGSSGRLPRQIGAAFEAVNTAFNAPLHGFRDRSITAFGAPLKSLTNIEYSSPSSSYIHSHRSANPTLNLSLNQRKERIRIASTTARNFDFPPPLRGALPPCRLTPTQARHTPQKERPIGRTSWNLRGPTLLAALRADQVMLEQSLQNKSVRQGERRRSRPLPLFRSVGDRIGPARRFSSSDHAAGAPNLMRVAALLCRHGVTILRRLWPYHRRFLLRRSGTSPAIPFCR